MFDLHPISYTVMHGHTDRVRRDCPDSYFFPEHAPAPDLVGMKIPSSPSKGRDRDG